MRPSTIPTLLVLSALGLQAGCTDKGGDDSGSPDTDTQPAYDEGCITVDGAGGYAHLADAITVASEGSTIALCAGTWDEVVTVDKGVTITGAGIDQTILQGDGTNPPLDLVGANITVSGLTIASPYLGIRVSGATDTIDGVKFDATGSWSVQANAATDLVVSNCEFTEPTDGGIDIEGGTATITGNTLTLPDAFGIQIAADAVATVSDNVIDGVIADKRNYKDGYGVNVDTATATLSGNEIAGAGSVCVKVSGGTLDASGETWTESPYGLLVDTGSASVDSSTIDGQTIQGIYAVGDSLSVSNSTVTGDPDLVCSNSYNTFFGGDYSCGGILLAADVEATVTDTTVSGWNDYGVMVIPYTGTAVIASLDGVTVDNTGRFGVYLASATAAVTDLAITNLREPELTEPCYDDTYGYTISYSAALFANGGELDLVGGSLATNQGWGIVAATGRVAVDGTSFTDNACTSLLNYQSAVTVENAAFSGYSSTGSIWNYIGATSVSGTSFANNRLDTTYSYDYPDGTGHVTTYEYAQVAGLDYDASQSTDVITNSTFSDGVVAIATYAADIEVTDSTFTNYASDVLEFQSNSRQVFSGNVAEGLSGPLLYLYGGEIEMNDNTIGTTSGFENSYSYYTDGVLQDGYPYTYTSYSTLLTGQSGYDSSGNALPGDIIVDGLTVEDSQSYLFYLSDCGAELSNVDVGSSGVGSAVSVLYGYWRTTDPLLVVDGLTVENALGGGISLNDYGNGAAYVELSNLEFGTVTGTGIYASKLSGLDVANADLGDVSGTGVQYIGQDIASSTATFDDVTVGAGTANGFELSRLLTATITNSSAVGRSIGLSLDGIGAADVEVNAFTGNAFYGMSCVDATFTSCAGNDLSGNTLGMQDGCSEDCGL